MAVPMRAEMEKSWMLDVAPGIRCFLHSVHPLLKLGIAEKGAAYLLLDKDKR